jgi:hypothetical protein
MSVLETQWWMLELPEEWQASQEDEMILIEDQDGVGEIAITTLEKEHGEVTSGDLLELSEELGKGEPVSVSGIEGYYFHYQEEGDALREWYLGADSLIILITYACDQENAGMDDGAVDEILSTLALRVKAD